MTVAAIVVLALKLSIALLVFGLGLKAEFRQLGYLLRHPRHLLRSVLAMNLVMPLIAVGMALVLPLSHALKIMLVAIALSPVPPILPRKEIKAGGRESYAISLLVTAALLSVISIPVAMAILGPIFGLPLSIRAATVAQVVFLTVLGPMGAGLAVRALMPRLAQRIAGPASLLAAAVLLLASLVLLFALRKPILAELDALAILTVSAFVMVALAVGHVLGGPAPPDRTVLAISTASRHPGMALAIASANFPEKASFMAALVVYLVISLALSAVYVMLRRRVAARAGEDVDPGFEGLSGRPRRT